MNLTAWARSINGHTLDLDGAFPGECHDVFLSWLYALGGTPGDGHAPGTGYTDQVWRQFPHYRPGLTEIFTKHTGKNIRPGDAVFWAKYSGVGGLPHVAIALEAPRTDGTVLCVTQNPGPVQNARLSLDGVLGVLRPNALATATLTIPHGKKKTMHMIDTTAYMKDKNAPGHRWAVVGPGFFLEVYNKKEADELAKIYGDSIRVDGARYRKHREAAQDGMK